MEVLKSPLCRDCKIQNLSNDKRQEVGECVVNLLSNTSLSEANYVDQLIAGNTEGYRVGDERLQAYVLCADAHTAKLPKTSTEQVAVKICPVLRSTIVVG